MIPMIQSKIFVSIFLVCSTMDTKICDVIIKIFLFVCRTDYSELQELNINVSFFVSLLWSSMYINKGKATKALLNQIKWFSFWFIVPFVRPFSTKNKVCIFKRVNASCVSIHLVYTIYGYLWFNFDILVLSILLPVYY